MNRYLLLIFAVALVARVGMALWLPPKPTMTDGKRYNRIASNLLTQGEFGVQERAAPLHPLLLAGLYSVTGQNMHAARIMTAVLGAMTCVVVFFLGRTCFNSTVGLLAAAGLALYPLHAFISAMFEYPNCLYILLLMLTLTLCVGLLRRPAGWLRWVGAGATLGLSALANPLSLACAPFIALWMLFISPLRFAESVARVTALTLGCCAVVFGWSGYWYANYGQIRLVAEYSGENLHKGNCPLAWKYGNADIADVFRKENRDPQTDPEFAEYIRVEDAAKAEPFLPARDDIYKAAAKRYIRENPGRAAAHFGWKLLNYWLPYARPITRHQGDSTASRVLQAVTFVPVGLLALWAAWRYRSEWRILGLLYLVVLVHWLAYSVYIVSARYRSQTDPLLIVLAAAVLVGFWQRRRGAERLEAALYSERT